MKPGLKVVPLRTPTLAPATHTNTVIAGEGDFVVLDPGSPYPKPQLELATHVLDASSRGKFVAILVSHHHPDHVGGVLELQAQFGVPIWAHRRTAELLPKLPVDRFLEDRDEIDLGDDSLEVWHTPGHADGHLAFAHPRSDTLLVGDLVASQGTILVDPKDGHMGDYLESLRRVLNAKPHALIPSHGDIILDVTARLEFYIHHRMERERRVYEVLSAQKTWSSASDLVPEVYGDKPRRVWPLAVQSTKAHLIHLAEQGLAESNHGKWRAI